MNERDRAAADDWMRDMPDPDQYSLEDSEDEGDTQKYFFLRQSDSATVVYKVAVKDGKRIFAFTVVLKSDPVVRQTTASTRLNLTCPDNCQVPGNMRAIRHRELLFAASKK